MQTTNDKLKGAVFLFDGEVKDTNEILESIGKRKKAHAKGNLQDSDSKPIQVSIFLPCVSRIFYYGSCCQVTSFRFQIYSNQQYNIYKTIGKAYYY